MERIRAKRLKSGLRTGQTPIALLVQHVTDAARTDLLRAARIVRHAFLVPEALVAQLRIMQAAVAVRVRMLARGAHADPVPAVRIVADAVVRQPAVLAQVARLVAALLPLDVVRTVHALAGVVAAFRVARAERVLALVVV